MFLDLGTTRFDITYRAVVMGILNRTPDSFYDQGSYFEFEDFLRKAEQLVADGADFLDVGGVKAGPGEDVGEQEELDRVVPAIEALRSRFDLPLSVDTWRASVAKACFESGACIGNDISGFADPDYLDVCSAARARTAGIPRERIMVDAGLDLGKSELQSKILLRSSDALTSLGYPVFLSASNKRFLWTLLDVERGSAGDGTMAAHSLGIALGCRILRAHDVRNGRRVADSMAAILEVA